MKNYTKESLKSHNGITLIALVITVILLLILAGLSISTLSGGDSIIQKAAYTRQISELAEVKEQARIDIISWITTNYENSSLDDSKVKTILTGKSYVKEAKNTSFITANGEYEIPYSELYTATVAGEWTYTDNSNDAGTENAGVLSIGDLVTPINSTLINEKFYVVSINGDRVIVLAQRNVNTTTNVQADGTNPVAFDSSTNVYKNTGNTGIKKYVDDYVSNFTSAGINLLDVDVDNDGTVDNSKGRLLFKSEIDELRGTTSGYSTSTCTGNKAFINATDIWLADIPNPNQVATLISGPMVINSATPNSNTYYGVRPIIEISKSLIISE